MTYVPAMRLRRGPSAAAGAVVGALALAIVLVGGPGFPTTPTALLLVVAYGGLVCAWRGGARLDRRLVVGLGGVLLVLAVARPPTQSHDVWSYVMYGRIVSEHHESPYEHTPDEFAHDPFVARVDPVWRDSRSVYGPAFSAWSAVITGVAGSSALAARLGFQLTAAVAVAGAAFVVHRTRRGDGAALALVLLNPVVVISAVNDAHVDALVALALAVGVVLLESRRHVLAGVALGVGLLVKVNLALAVFGIGLWLLLRRERWRALAPVLVTVAIVASLGYLAGGGRAALDPVADASGRVSRGSVWGPVYRAQTDGNHDAATTSTNDDTARRISRVSAVVVVALAAAVVWSYANEGVDVASIAGPLAYGLAAAFAYPWYACVIFPVLARRRHALLVLIALVHVASLQITWIAGRRFTHYVTGGGPPLPGWQDWYRSWGSALVQLGLVIALVAVLVRRRRSPQLEAVVL